MLASSGPFGYSQHWCYAGSQRGCARFSPTLGSVTRADHSRSLPPSCSVTLWNDTGIRIGIVPSKATVELICATSSSQPPPSVSLWTWPFWHYRGLSSDALTCLGARDFSCFSFSFLAACKFFQSIAGGSDGHLLTPPAVSAWYPFLSSSSSKSTTSQIPTSHGPLPLLPNGPCVKSIFHWYRVR